MEDKPTRAAAMAAQYGKKLDELNPTAPKPREIKSLDKQAPEQQERLRKALQKLADFRDLVR